MIDDDDELLFDEPDDDDDVAAERTNFLVVPARPPCSEIINQLEEEYRRRGHPPVLFVDVSDDGMTETFLNAAELATAMKLLPGVLPTLAQAEDWILAGMTARRWVNWEW